MISWGGEEELKQLEKEQGEHGQSHSGTAGGCETDGGHSEGSPPEQGSARPGRGPCFHRVQPATVHQAELAGPGASLFHICTALGNGDPPSGHSCSCHGNDKINAVRNAMKISTKTQQ